MFTIVFSNGRMRIEPCSRTQKWNDILTKNEFEPFLPLPLQDDQENGVELPSSYFRHLFRHGLCFSTAADNSSVVTVDISYKDDCKRLPFYMFPVMHFPVLLQLEHSGWFYNGILLNNVEYFQTKHYNTFHVRDCDEEWFRETNAEAYNVYLQCMARFPELCMHACFASWESCDVLGFWAQTQSDAKLAYYESVDQIKKQFVSGTFMDTSMFVPSKTSTCRSSGTSYLMIEHNEHGLTPVRYVTPALSCSEEAPNKHILISFEAVGVEFSVSSDTFKPRLLSAGEETKNDLHYIWGLTIENNNQAFVENGCYTVSSLASNAFCEKSDSVLLQMDFITMSRCMLSEGSEIWINVTPQIYQLIQQQGVEQGYKIMLPVTKHLHNSMQGLCYLRGFYILSGSLHDIAIDNNHVRIICVIKHNTWAKRIIEDDNAGAESLVNTHTNIKNTRLVAFTLPVLQQIVTADGKHLISPIIVRHRNQGAPFYKYLSEAHRL
jgi:hypothetical protein